MFVALSVPSGGWLLHIDLFRKLLCFVADMIYLDLADRQKKILPMLKEVNLESFLFDFQGSLHLTYLFYHSWYIYFHLKFENLFGYGLFIVCPNIFEITYQQPLLIVNVKPSTAAVAPQTVSSLGCQPMWVQS